MPRAPKRWRMLSPELHGETPPISASRGDDMQELANRVAIVTGAAKNIGRAIARDLAEGGAAVVVVAHSDVTSAEKVAAEIRAGSGRAIALQCDVGDCA